MKKPLGNGSLFPNKARSAFMSLSGSRYDSMVARLEKKKLLPGFTKDEFRAHILRAIAVYDGFAQCRYCKGFFTMADLAADHEIPLSRGGSPGLENIGFPCTKCNQIKGSMTPFEAIALLEFLELEIPLAKTDVTSRLQKAVPLAASARRNAVMIRNMRASGEWKAKRTKDVLQRVIEDEF